MKLYKSNFHAKTFLQTLVVVRNVPGIDAKPYHGKLILKSFKRSACPCKTRLAWQLKKLWSIATLRIENKRCAKVSFPRASWYFNKL